MKVVFATGIYPPDIGGPASYVKNLARELREREHDVEVVSYGEATDTEPIVPVRRVSRELTLPLRYGRFFRQVRAASRGADLVFLQDPLSSGLPGLLGSRSRGCPILLKVVADLAWEIAREQNRTEDDVVSFQSRQQRPSVELFRRVQSWVARRSDRILVPSQYLRGIVTKWRVSSEKIDVVYNSVPTRSGPELTADQAKATLGLASRLVLFSAGRLVPWKRFDTLITLMPRLLSRFPQLQLVIAGGGPCEQGLRELARREGVESAVRLTGGLPFEQMRTHLRAADILVLASTHEGFSHLLLEALCSEVPVVATAVGGNSELIEDGESGRLVPLGRVDLLEDALVDVLSNPKLRQRLRAGGRARVEQFRWDNMVEATLQSFERAAHCSRRPLASRNSSV